MRSSKTSYILVGAFALVLGAAFIWGVLWISAGGTPQSIDRYVVYMTDSVSGLNVDAPLKYRGVDVGKVEQISIDGNNPERVRLLLQVRQGTPVNSDTVATLEYQGLTGIANVNLSGGNATSLPLKKLPGEDYPVIKSRPSIFSSLDSTLHNLLTNLTETSAGINALLNEENRTNFSRSIENFALLTQRIADQSEQLGTIVSDLQATLQNTHAASENFPMMVQQVSTGAKSITSMANEIRAVGKNLVEASSKINSTVEASGADLRDFTGTALPEMTVLLNELRLASENLRRMSESLARDPSVLIYGKPALKRGPGE
jgi:phospholipid/cholesterol/gamma-HCH transport system substrate-binding protein